MPGDHEVGLGLQDVADGDVDGAGGRGREADGLHPVRQREVFAVDRLGGDDRVPLAALVLGGRHDADVADGLEDLRHRGNAGRAHAVVVADEDAVGRRIGTLTARPAAPLRAAHPARTTRRRRQSRRRIVPLEGSPDAAPSARSLSLPAHLPTCPPARRVRQDQNPAGRRRRRRAACATRGGRWPSRSREQQHRQQRREHRQHGADDRHHEHDQRDDGDERAPGRARRGCPRDRRAA